jgi:microcompartment protein CcmK/EutM
MQIGLVVGTATSTVKHPTMKGQKLLIVQPMLVDGTSTDGDPQIAIDAVGAGRGERVLISSDGRYTRDILKADATPVRWSVIGIAD